MDKDNVFCSNKFWMSNGDKLHVIIKDLVGTMPDIELYDEDGNAEDATPSTPVALPATNVLFVSFSANWEASDYAEGYYIDVSLNADFSSIVAGYSNLDVGNVLTYGVTGLTPGVIYYYRVMAYGASGTSSESNVITSETLEYGYGALYNQYAVTDARNLTSVGWHISTDAEWVTLRTYLDPDGDALSNTAGREMKIEGDAYWDDDLGLNTSGFNGKGAGRRTGLGFNGLKDSSTFWTSSALPANSYLLSSGDGVLSYAFHGNAYYGQSVRPVKDSTALSHGQTGTYTDPSGYVYDTICIGTQEWVSENIKTEHYRNGDAISVVTDAGTWNALVTGAMCYYNNDESYA